MWIERIGATLVFPQVEAILVAALAGTSLVSLVLDTRSFPILTSVEGGTFGDLVKRARLVIRDLKIRSSLVVSYAIDSMDSEVD